MAKGKKPRTKEQGAAQKVRTAQNQIKRFTKNIEQRPNHSHAKVWISKVTHYESALR